MNLQLFKKVPVIFHNLRGYDSHLIFSELDQFDVKINVIPNGLEEYMEFYLNKNLVFMDSMKFMNSSLDTLVKNLSDEDFKILNFWKIFKLMINSLYGKTMENLQKGINVRLINNAYIH